jgi:hypothetical protein
MLDGRSGAICPGRAAEMAPRRRVPPLAGAESQPPRPAAGNCRPTCPSAKSPAPLWPGQSRVKSRSRYSTLGSNPDCARPEGQISVGPAAPGLQPGFDPGPWDPDRPARQNPGRADQNSGSADQNPGRADQNPGPAGQDPGAHAAARLRRSCGSATRPGHRARADARPGFDVCDLVAGHHGHQAGGQIHSRQRLPPEGREPRRVGQGGASVLLRSPPSERQRRNAPQLTPTRRTGRLTKNQF